MPQTGRSLAIQSGEPYKNAVKLQRLLIAAADKESVSPTELAAVARAWDVLEERKRVMKMRPAPKAIDPTKVNKPARKSELSPILAAPSPAPAELQPLPAPQPVEYKPDE